MTYFGGCPEKGLGPDLEARDYWISLGYGVALFFYIFVCQVKKFLNE